jgi:hypothetical protein
MATLVPSGFANEYIVLKNGPGYDGGGFALLTRSKRLGIYTTHLMPGTTNDIIITSLSGTFNTNKFTGKISGFDETNFLSLTIGSSTAPVGP